MCWRRRGWTGTAYVGCRGTATVQLHYGRDDFADQRQLAASCRATAPRTWPATMPPSDQDRARAFAERREIRFPELAREIAAKVRDKAKGMFDGFRPKAVRETSISDVKAQAEPAIGASPTRPGRSNAMRARGRYRPDARQGLAGAAASGERIAQGWRGAGREPAPCRA
jgi:hypothetical protein